MTPTTKIKDVTDEHMISLLREISLLTGYDFSEQKTFSLNDYFLHCFEKHSLRKVIGKFEGEGILNTKLKDLNGTAFGEFMHNLCVEKRVAVQLYDSRKLYHAFAACFPKSPSRTRHSTVPTRAERIKGIIRQWRANGDL